MKQLRILSMATSALLPGEIGVDLFAGGGGFSEGFLWATGVPPAVAVDHDEDAIVMHTANHPETEHHHTDVFEVDPIEATRGRAVGWLHLSPDCTHFARARGGKPRSQHIRALATIAIPWAKAVRPRIISLENVPEFLSWGPLDEEGQPIKARAGETFREFVGELEALGYEVQWRTLKACDYGAPTSRTRLFLIARRDGRPIRWPVPTHGKGRLPYRTAAECIDRSIAIPSIFDRKKPQADATLRRIAAGIRRFVLENPRPFIVNLTHGGREESIDEPMRTITAAHRGEKALIAPTLIQAGYGEREGQKPRILNLHAPLGTVVAQGNKFSLVAAMLKHYGGVVGHTLDRPLGTITTVDHHSVVAATIAKLEVSDELNGRSTLHSEREADSNRSGRHDLASGEGATTNAYNSSSLREAEQERVLHGSLLAERSPVFGGGSSPRVDCAQRPDTGRHGHQPQERREGGQPPGESGAGDAIGEPHPCVQSLGAEGAEDGGVWSLASNDLIAPALCKYYGCDEHGQPIDAPLHTIPTKDRFGLVAAFLTRFNGTSRDGNPIDEPLGTITASGEHFGVVTVTIDGEIYAIADIGMRMLQARELARAQGFPDSYVLTGSKTQQVARIGNSVVPQVAAAIVSANLSDDDDLEAAA